MTADQVLEIALKAIGTITLAGGGVAVIVVALFKTVGEKWLVAKFDERLTGYKHDQQKEIEQLKFEMNKLMDRTTKFHQKEFDVLPEAWSKLVY